MRLEGRIGAVLLGVLLAIAWSAGAEAGFATGKKKGKGNGKKAPAAQVAPQGNAQGAPSFQPDRRVESRRPEAQRPKAERRDNAPSFERRRDDGAPSYQRPSAQRPSATRPSRTTRPDIDRGALVNRPSAQRPLPGGRAESSRLTSGNRPALSPSRTTQAAPTLIRGGKTFRQEPLVNGNQTFIRRTPVTRMTTSHHGGNHHGGPGGDSGRTYHHHPWHHHDYWVYVHFWVYDPWFWGFYFAPFPTPWYYTWYWVGDPWYVAWGWYYAPYPYYAGPSYWVTDYTISRMLEDEYDRGYDAGRASAMGTPISEPVKEQIRLQVDATAQAFQTEQSIALEAALADPNYLFIVDAPISASTKDGATCALTGGDIIQNEGEVDPAIPVATMRVVTSKSDSCPVGASVNISYTDLQEMLNSFSEAVDDGLHELENQPTPRAD